MSIIKFIGYTFTKLLPLADMNYKTWSSQQESSLEEEISLPLVFSSQTFFNIIYLRRPHLKKMVIHIFFYMFPVMIKTFDDIATCLF